MTLLVKRGYDRVFKEFSQRGRWYVRREASSVTLQNGYDVAHSQSARKQSRSATKDLSLTPKNRGTYAVQGRNTRSAHSSGMG